MMNKCYQADPRSARKHLVSNTSPGAKQLLIEMAIQLGAVLYLAGTLAVTIWFWFAPAAGR